MIRTLWASLGPLLSGRERLACAGIALGSLAIGLLEAAVMVIIVSVAVSVADQGSAVTFDLPVVGAADLSPGNAVVISGLLACLILVGHALLAWLTARLSASVLHSVRVGMITAFSMASWERQSEDREGSVQEAVSTLSIYTAELVMQLGTFAAGASGLVMMLAAAFVVSPGVTAGVLLVGALLFLALRPIGRVTRRAGAEFTGVNSMLSESVTSWTTLAMDLRVFGVEAAEADRLVRESRRTSSARAKSSFVSRFGSDLFKDVAVVFMVSGVGALQLLESVDVASAGAVILLIVRSLSYAQMVNTSSQAINERGANLESLMTRIHSLEASATRFGSEPLEAIGPIELEEASYYYADDRVGVERLSLRVAPGEVIGVVGPSGGGKSTLVQLLLRLRPPSAGRVVVGGVDYLEVDSHAWQSLVSLVPQEPRMFAGTVADNITFHRKGFTREQIRSAAADAHVAEDISRMPDGFDTLLGPRGAGISGGQKQRIAIARALLGRPKLLVLDEPTSALDVRSEALIQATIEELKGEVTMVVVAHRLSTLSSCDRVVALEDGRIKHVGSLAEALETVSLDVGD